MTLKIKVTSPANHLQFVAGLIVIAIFSFIGWLKVLVLVAIFDEILILHLKMLYVIFKNEKLWNKLLILV